MSQIQDARLYSHGTKLADVPPDFHGISWNEWLKLREAFWKTQPQPRSWPPLEERQWFKRPVATARDAYGWKSGGR